MFRLFSLGLITVQTKPIKIIAVGDSITEGADELEESSHSWPSQLNHILNKKGGQYTVQNFGRSGRTMRKKGDNPYWN